MVECGLAREMFEARTSAIKFKPERFSAAEPADTAQQSRNEETQIPRRVRVIFRVMSVLTFVEGGTGLFWTVLNVILVPFHLKTLENLVGHSYPYWAPLLYLISPLSG